MEINLKAAWTYRTPLVTAEYPAGKHKVSGEIAAAALAAGVIEAEKEKADGDGTAKTGTPRAADKAEG